MYSMLRNVARNVRRWAEKKYDSDDLDCLCAICSAEIFIRLLEKGRKPVFCEVGDDMGGHCYVICDGYLVDVTAMQFDKKLPKVSVFKKSLMKTTENDLWFWDKPQHTARSVRGIKMLMSEWPEDQSPFEEGED